MSELVLTVLRLSFLVLIWLLVLWCLRTLRSDIYGTRVGARSSGRRRLGRRSDVPLDDGGDSPAPRRSGPVTLVVLAGPLVLIGRAPSCTLVLDDDFASGRHARIFPHDGRWFVEDLGSTNGSWLGDHRVGEPEPMEPGLQLKIGQTVIELRK